MQWANLIRDNAFWKNQIQLYFKGFPLNNAIIATTDYKRIFKNNVEELRSWSKGRQFTNMALPLVMKALRGIIDENNRMPDLYIFAIINDYTIPKSAYPSPQDQRWQLILDPESSTKLDFVTIKALFHLCVICKFGQLKKFQLLLDQYQDVLLKRHKERAFIQAAVYGHSNLIQHLLNHSNSTTLSAEQVFSPDIDTLKDALVGACISNSVKITELILKKIKEVNQNEGHIWVHLTLIEAIRYRSLRVFKYLFAQKIFTIANSNAFENLMRSKELRESRNSKNKTILKHLLHPSRRQLYGSLFRTEHRLSILADSKMQKILRPLNSNDPIAYFLKTLINLTTFWERPSQNPNITGAFSALLAESYYSFLGIEETCKTYLNIAILANVVSLGIKVRNYLYQKEAKKFESTPIEEISPECVKAFEAGQESKKSWLTYFKSYLSMNNTRRALSYGAGLVSKNGISARRCV